VDRRRTRRLRAGDLAVTEYVVAYDIRDDDDRARVAALLSRWGVRQQRSVFVCELDEEAQNGLLEALERFLIPDPTWFNSFAQCGSCRDARWGHGQVVPGIDEPFWII
jgi:CRISPR-associated protein Cas2